MATQSVRTLPGTPEDDQRKADETKNALAKAGEDSANNTSMPTKKAWMVIGGAMFFGAVIGSAATLLFLKFRKKA